MGNLPENVIKDWYESAASAGGLSYNFRILSLINELNLANQTIKAQDALIGRYISERGQMAAKLEKALAEHYGGIQPTDDLIKEWMTLAQTRLDEGHPADPAALETIIILCELVLQLRHPKQVFQNLLHQG